MLTAANLLFDFRDKDLCVEAFGRRLVPRRHGFAESRRVDSHEIESDVLVGERVSGKERQQAGYCASASMIMTPGISGRVGKCPMKKGSL